MKNGAWPDGWSLLLQYRHGRYTGTMAMSSPVDELVLFENDDDVLAFCAAGLGHFAGEYSCGFQQSSVECLQTPCVSQYFKPDISMICKTRRGAMKEGRMEKSVLQACQATPGLVPVTVTMSYEPSLSETVPNAF